MPGTYNEGELGLNPEPLLFADDPAWYQAELNLVYLNYAQSGGVATLAALNPGDTRALVFGTTTYWSSLYPTPLA